MMMISAAPIMLPKVLVISLLSSTERRRRISSRLAALGIPFQFLDAIDGRNVQLDRTIYDPERILVLNGKPLLPGQIGCFLSHVEAWRRLIASGEETMLILEDDAEPLPELVDFLQFTDGLERDWEIVILSDAAPPTQGKHPVARQTLSKHFSVTRFARPGYFASGYLIHRRGAERLLRTAFPMRHPVDHWNDHSWRCALVVDRATPAPIIHDEKCESTIGPIKSNPLPITVWLRRLIGHAYIHVRASIRFRRIV